MKRRVIVLIIAAVLVPALLIWLLWANSSPAATQVTVASGALPEAFEGFKIAHVSDLHNAVFGRKNEKLLLLLETICGTGIRVSELRYITAEAVRQGEAVIQLKGKTRVILLSGKLKRALQRYIRKAGICAGPVFVTRSGKPLDRSNVWKMMKTLCRDADVERQKVFPHNLRHLFARCFYAVEKDIAKLADVLGHSSINTTRVYIMSSGSEHRRCMDALGLMLSS